MQIVVDMSVPAEKQLMLANIRKLEGVHRIEIVKYRKRRTDAQNRYMWPCVIAPFGDFLRGQGESITDEACHQILKFKFLRTSVVNPGTGEIIGERVRSTTELNIEEFSEYLEKCMAWLAEFGIECPTAEVMRMT